MLTFVGAIKANADPSKPHAISRVPEVVGIRSNITDSNESDTVQKPLIWPPPLDEDNNDAISSQRRLCSDSWMQMGSRHEPNYKDIVSGHQSFGNNPRGFCLQFFEETPCGLNYSNKNHCRDHGGGDRNLLASSYSLRPAESPLNRESSRMKVPPQISELPCWDTQNINYSNLGEFSQVQNLRTENSSPKWLTQLLPASQKQHVPHTEMVRTNESGIYKLFGFHLNSIPPASDQMKSLKNPNVDPISSAPTSVPIKQAPAAEENTTSVSTAAMESENGKYIQQCPQSGNKDVQSKLQGGPRSCTKVIFFFFIIIYLVSI